jgi:ribosomal protein L19
MRGEGGVRRIHARQQEPDSRESERFRGQLLSRQAGDLRDTFTRRKTGLMEAGRTSSTYAEFTKWLEVLRRSSCQFKRYLIHNRITLFELSLYTMSKISNKGCFVFGIHHPVASLAPVHTPYERIA